MKVKQLFTVLKGENRIQLTNDSLRKLGLEEKAKQYSRQEFFHKYRRSSAWESEIDNFRTDTVPSGYAGHYLTLVTIELASISCRKCCETCRHYNEHGSAATRCEVNGEARANAGADKCRYYL